MGSIGFAEIAVIAVLALLVLGPDRLPGAARQIGQALAQLRGMTSGVKKDFEEALDASDLRDTINEFRGTMDELNPKRVVSEALGSSNFTMASGAQVKVDSATKAVTTSGVSTAAADIPPPDGDVPKWVNDEELTPPPVVVDPEHVAIVNDPFLKSFPPIPRREPATAPLTNGGRFHDVLLDDDLDGSLADGLVVVPPNESGGA